jgi:uncharacterized protein (DUF3820 family)
MLRVKSYRLNFGKYEGKTLKEVPGNYVEWLIQEGVYKGRKDLADALEVDHHGIQETSTEGSFGNKGGRKEIVEMSEEDNRQKTYRKNPVRLGKHDDIIAKDGGEEDEARRTRPKSQEWDTPHGHSDRGQCIQGEKKEKEGKGGRWGAVWWVSMVVMIVFILAGVFAWWNNKGRCDTGEHTREDKYNHDHHANPPHGTPATSFSFFFLLFSLYTLAPVAVTVRGIPLLGFRAGSSGFILLPTILRNDVVVFPQSHWIFPVRLLPIVFLTHLNYFLPATFIPKRALRRCFLNPMMIDLERVRKVLPSFVDSFLNQPLNIIPRDFLQRFSLIFPEI